MLSQKEAVFTVVTGIVDVTSGTAVNLTKEQRKEAITALIAMTNEGEVEVKSDKATANLSEYWSGCLSNHLRKDLRLNGGSKYEPKNPGSRAGSGDAVLRELKKLFSTLSNEDDQTRVQEQINLRMAAIAASKVKSVAIDADQIPEELRHLIPA